MYHLARANLFLSWPFSFTKSLSDSLSKPVPKYKKVTPHHLIWELTLPTFITAVKGDIVTFLSHHPALKALQPSAVCTLAKTFSLILIRREKPRQVQIKRHRCLCECRHKTGKMLKQSLGLVNIIRIILLFQFFCRFKIFSRTRGVLHTDIAFDLLHVAVHELTMIVKKKKN